MKRIVQKNFEEKLNYLLKQKLRYNGELIILTIHVTILTLLLSNSDITIYADEILAAGVSLMVYHHPGDSGIRQC